MKKYEWGRLRRFTFTWSRPLENESAPVDLNDPALPDEIVEIDLTADPFEQE
jgi:hypothetical protein